MSTDPAKPSGVTEEFEREPVPAHRLKGLRSFLAMYGGEHVAGTEFMIGPLFLAAGVSAFDLLVGLIIGNLLAVLSWTLICAPIATRARLTLYYQLEKICGARLVTLYNLANGILFCFLAGAMVTVSATAVGIPFGMKMPGLNELLPTSVTWVVLVLAIGAVFSYVAARGYDAMARVANWSVPFLILIFLICGFVALRQLGVHSPGEFWSAARDRIWTGGNPLPGQTKFTFWHVMFFAWFCNAAMHMGLADLSILRYARRWQYGLASTAGMFIGHYMAWISASMLYAVQLLKAGWDPSQVAPPSRPGPWRMTRRALPDCSVSSSRVGPRRIPPSTVPAWHSKRSCPSPRALPSPCSRRSGHRCGAFPALVMRLLDFVGLYGTILMPMGAVIFVDFHLLRRLGLQPNFAEKTGVSFHWPAGAAWLLALALCGLLNRQFHVQVYFLALPGWFLAGLFYLGFSWGL